ncbi:MAG: CRISPR-associated endonuclease Cas2 [Patescibacteria group bacterium]
MVHYQAHSPLTKVLLNFLSGLKTTTIELGHLVSAISTHYGSAYRHGGYEYVVELKRLADKREVRQVVKRLRRSRYIKVQKIGKRLMVALTDKGKAATLVQRLRAAPPHRPNYFTIVIFDIPESQRAARLQLRALLKQGGFWLLQHSVWVSNQDAYQELAAFIKLLKLERWVNVYHATDLLYLPKK